MPVVFWVIVCTNIRCVGRAHEHLHNNIIICSPTTCRIILEYCEKTIEVNCHSLHCTRLLFVYTNNNMGGNGGGGLIEVVLRDAVWISPTQEYQLSPGLLNYTAISTGPTYLIIYTICKHH